MWDGIANAFISAINALIGGWNSLHFTIPSFDTHIPGIGTIVRRLDRRLPLTPSPTWPKAGSSPRRHRLRPRRRGHLPGAGSARKGPAVQIENLNLASGLDVETFMKRAAWVAQTEAI